MKKVTFKEAHNLLFEASENGKLLKWADIFISMAILHNNAIYLCDEKRKIILRIKEIDNFSVEVVENNMKFKVFENPVNIKCFSIVPDSF